MQSSQDNRTMKLLYLAATADTICQSTLTTTYTAMPPDWSTATSKAVVTVTANPAPTITLSANPTAVTAAVLHSERDCNELNSSKDHWSDGSSYTLTATGALSSQPQRQRSTPQLRQARGTTSTTATVTVTPTPRDVTISPTILITREYSS